MKTIYKISSDETGTILIRRRKIAKAFRWWLRDNGFNFKHSYSTVDSDYRNGLLKKNP
jgi:hypothetical protein